MINFKIFKNLFLYLIDDFVDCSLNISKLINKSRFLSLNLLKFEQWWWGHSPSCSETIQSKVPLFKNLAIFSLFLASFNYSTVILQWYFCWIDKFESKLTHFGAKLSKSWTVWLNFERNRLQFEINTLVSDKFCDIYTENKMRNNCKNMKNERVISYLI